MTKSASNLDYSIIILQYSTTNTHLVTTGHTIYHITWNFNKISTNCVSIFATCYIVITMLCIMRDLEIPLLALDNEERDMRLYKISRRIWQRNFKPSTK